jgi:hypothetical protein|tara:strand:- start:376 stop:573 length:198 start_codon:yes stop_codon:yes gene_type:complete
VLCALELLDDVADHLQPSLLGEDDDGSRSGGELGRGAAGLAVFEELVRAAEEVEDVSVDAMRRHG